MLPETATVIQLAKILACSRKTVYGHINKAGLERDLRKKYNVHQVLIAVYEHRKEDSRRIPQTSAKVKKYNLECELLEQKIKIFNGEYVPATAVEDLLEKVVVAIKAKLLSLPTKIATRIVGAKKLSEAKEILDESTKEILNELADLNITRTHSNSEAKAIQPAAKTDRKPVGRRKPKIKQRIKCGTRAMANK